MHLAQSRAWGPGTKGKREISVGCPSTQATELVRLRGLRSRVLQNTGAVYSSRGICIAVIHCRSPSHTIVYGKVDVKRKLIHSHDYKARGSVTLSRGLELGEKLMEDSKAGDRLKDYYLSLKI